MNYKLFLLTITVFILFQSCRNENNEPIIYQAQYIGKDYLDEEIHESYVEFVKREDEKTFFKLITNRIQENQKISSVKCDLENGVYRFVFLLSPDNWLDPHPFKSQTVDFSVSGLPKGVINIAVSLNYGDIPLMQNYILILGSKENH